MREKVRRIGVGAVKDDTAARNFRHFAKRHARLGGRTDLLIVPRDVETFHDEASPLATLTTGVLVKSSTSIPFFFASVSEY